MAMRTSRFLLFFILLTSPVYGAVDFDGGSTTQRVSIADTSTLDFGTSTLFTIVAWIRPDTVGISQHIYIKGDINNSTAAYEIWLVGDEIRFDIQDSSNSLCGVTTSAANLSANVWQHITATLSNRDATCSTDDFEIWVDGSSESTTLTFSGVGSNANIDNNQASRIGQRFIGGSSTQAFNGEITEFAVWSTNLDINDAILLSSSRVKGMPYQVKPAFQVVYLPLNDLSDGTSIHGQVFYNRFASDPGSFNGNDTSANSVVTAEDFLTYP